MAQAPTSDISVALNIDEHPNAKKLVNRCLEFFEKIKDLCVQDFSRECSKRN